MNTKIIGNRERERKSNIDLGLAERLNEQAEKGTKEEHGIREEIIETNQGLEYDIQEKPTLKLTPLIETVVHTPTQEEYWEVMRVSECGGFEWSRGVLLTSINLWKKHKAETCVNITTNIDQERRFGYCYRNYYQGKNWNIISTQEFYNTQKITLNQIQEINEWFENQPESK